MLKKIIDSEKNWDQKIKNNKNFWEKHSKNKFKLKKCKYIFPEKKK